MRYAFITSQAFSVHNFRGPLIRELVAGGSTVFALAPDYNDESRAEVMALGAVPLDYHMSRTGMNPWHDGHALLGLALLLRRLQPDVMLAYFIKPVIYGTLAAWLAGVPRRVAMIEGLGYVFSLATGRITWRRRVLKSLVSQLYKFSLDKAHQVILLNRDDMAELVDARLLDQDKAINLGGIGVDLAEWPLVPTPTQPVTFLLAARLLREKGIVEYANAARQVKRLHPAVRFILLGGLDTNPGGLSDDEIRAWVTAGVIEWPGHVSVKPWLAQASVYVLPSYYREGLPRSTQEAMAMGRPVITTDAPGCRETVREGVNGYLVPVSDVPALAVAMLRFVEKPSIIEPMGRESRKMAEESFDVRKINTRLIKILDGTVELPPVDPQATDHHSITISIVSHKQIDMVTKLLLDLEENCRTIKFNLILTLNVPEEVPAFLEQLSYPIILLRNLTPVGFGENHNKAFNKSKTSFFCVINPDIRIDSNIFPELIEKLKDISFGVIAPLIVDGDGKIEDSARKFPTPFKILCKLIGRCREPDYQVSVDLIKPDWVGGMFMLFRKETYAKLRGFDQKFYLYYEDVDLCARMRLMGLRVVMNPRVKATHLARRSSHSNVAYSLLHVRSMARFFSSLVFFKVMLRRER